MRVCIAGKFNIAIEVCRHILQFYQGNPLFAIPNRGDDGRDGFQKSFRRFAEENHIPIVSLEDVYEWEDLVFLSLEFDRIIKVEKFASKELFNIHFSLLPRYKGCHTVAMPVLNGDEWGGVTLHKIDRGIDTGDIIDVQRIKIEKTETSRSLYLKYISTGSELVKRNLKSLFEKTYQTTPQAIANSTYYSRNELDYTNTQINFKRTAVQVDRQVRALSFREFQLPHYEDAPISRVEISCDRSTKTPGTLVEKTPSMFRVATVDYDVLLYKDNGCTKEGSSCDVDIAANTSKIIDCRILNLKRILDSRGNLSVIEENDDIPFAVKRAYWIYDVPGGETRGGHAYKTNKEFIVALSGSFDVVLDDGIQRTVFPLNRSYYGLYIPEGIWREMENFSTNAVALELASTEYNPSDYVRDYDEFLKLKKDGEI